jgi:hypothetical protein
VELRYRLERPGRVGEYGVKKVLQVGTKIGLGLTILLATLFSAAGRSKDSAPPSSNRSWSPPDLAEHQEHLRSHLVENPEVVIDSRKVYLLPDLIDIAERLNPQTKIAWQRAKQALAGVGLAESTYYPICQLLQPPGIPGSLLRSRR